MLSRIVAQALGAEQGCRKRPRHETVRAPRRVKRELHLCGARGHALAHRRRQRAQPALTWALAENGRRVFRPAGLVVTHLNCRPPQRKRTQPLQGPWRTAVRSQNNERHALMNKSRTGRCCRLQRFHAEASVGNRALPLCRGPQHAGDYLRIYILPLREILHVSFATDLRCIPDAMVRRFCEFQLHGAGIKPRHRHALEQSV